MKVHNRRFQLGEGPSRGLLRDYEIFANRRLTFVITSYLQVSGPAVPAWLPGSWLAGCLLGLGSLWVLLVAALLGISYGVSTITKQGGAFTQLHSV